MSGEGARQKTFVAQPHHQKKVGLSLKKDAVFNSAIHISLSAGHTLKHLYTIGKFVVFIFTPPQPKSDFFTKKKKQKLPDRYLVVNDGWGGDFETNSGMDDTMVLEFPGVNGGQNKIYRVKSSNGSGVQEFTEEKFDQFSLRRLAVDFTNLPRFHSKTGMPSNSPPFLPANVLAAIKQIQSENPNMHAAELMMNQEVFCGCGQVEKMEALFKYGIHPDEPIINITDEEWGTIVFFVVDFVKYWIQCQEHKYEARPPINKGDDFLKPRPETALYYLDKYSDVGGEMSDEDKKIWTQYSRRKNCVNCNAVIVQTMNGGGGSGGTEERRTFYCPVCQQLKSG
ncbi:hypothetical protein TrCOL_g13142 [Triparma columacea]|uniref:FPG-type domain-containing protein n=1 Tax=Triparma columacea TaxID=722753 RepID=A0A9W7G5S5_9STRA|nr:hypothetical protein TrCOL_g13142 [Triparma columacea]